MLLIPSQIPKRHYRTSFLQVDQEGRFSRTSSDMYKYSSGTEHSLRYQQMELLRRVNVQSAVHAIFFVLAHIPNGMGNCNGQNIKHLNIYFFIWQCSLVFQMNLSHQLDIFSGPKLFLQFCKHRISYNQHSHFLRESPNNLTVNFCGKGPGAKGFHETSSFESSCVRQFSCVNYMGALSFT